MLQLWNRRQLGAIIYDPSSTVLNVVTLTLNDLERNQKSLGTSVKHGAMIHMIRKGQACWSATGAKVCLLHRFILGLFAATN